MFSPLKHIRKQCSGGGGLKVWGATGNCWLYRVVRPIRGIKLYTTFCGSNELGGLGQLVRGTGLSSKCMHFIGNLHMYIVAVCCISLFFTLCGVNWLGGHPKAMSHHFGLQKQPFEPPPKKSSLLADYVIFLIFHEKFKKSMTFSHELARF